MNPNVIKKVCPRSVSPTLVGMLAAAFAGLDTSSLSAANIVRNGNATALNDPAAWSGAATPGNGDVATWNSSSTGFAAENLGGNFSWSGINISSATPGSVSISSSSATNLTLGSAGISLNNGATTNRGLTIANSVGVILGANQTWDLGNGQTTSANITVAGLISGSGSLTATRASTGNNTLVLSGANTFTGGFTLSANTTVTAGAAAVTALGGDTTSSPYGAYSGTTALTINGGRINQGAFAFQAKNVNVNGDFTLSTTARTDFGGTVNLGNATRTMTLTRSATAANTVILGGNIALRFSGVTNAPASFTNGTLRIAADPAVVNFVPVVANAGTTFASNAGLTLGEKVLFAAGTTTLTGATTVPSVTLETGSWWNLSEAGNVRNPQVNSLAGNGTVANLYTGSTANTLGTLTIKGNSGSTPTDFSGRIVDKDTSVFPTATNGITAVVKAGTTTQIFSGPNTYSAGTTIQAGTLQVSGNGTLGTGSITVGTATTSGTLDLAGVSLTNTALSLVNGAITGGGNITLSGATSLSKGSVNASLRGSTTVTKSTADTVTLYSVNTYTGATVIENGTLELSGSGSINSSSGVTLNGGVFKNNSSASLTVPLTFNGGTLGGTNLAGVSLSIGTGQKLSPGNSPGLLTTGNQTWNGGGSFDFEINNATGVQDTNWDRTLIVGTLTLGTVSNATPFTINLISLNGLSPGAAANFNSAVSQSWPFATATSIVGTAFAANQFVVNTAAFVNAFDGTFQVSKTDNQLYLTYTAIPEPSSLAALAGISTVSVSLLRRRRTQLRRQA